MYSSNIKDNVSEIKNSANEAKQELRDKANNVGRRLRLIYNTASSEITHAGEKVTSEIRTNPVRSSMIALAAGLVLGKLLRR